MTPIDLIPWKEFLYASPSPMWAVVAGRVAAANPAAIRLMDAAEEAAIVGREDLAFPAFDGTPVEVQLPRDGHAPLRVKLMGTTATPEIRLLQALPIDQVAETELLNKSIPIGLYQVDSTGRWIYSNDRYTQLTGLTRERSEGEGWLASIHPDDRDTVATVWRGARATVAEFRAEYRLAQTTADGATVWVMAHESPAFGDNGYFGTITDITDLKKALAAVAEGAERFETLANNINPLCWMADAAGSVFWLSDRWHQYTGRSFEQMQGWGWREVLHPDHVDRVVDKYWKSCESGEVWEDTFPLRSKDGAYRWFLSRARPIRDASGRIARWFGTNTDVTELRQLEAALNQQNIALQRSNEDLSRFAFVASHDLQEPLRMVMSFAQLVQRSTAGRLDEKSAGYIERIVEGASRMSRLIQDLLTYANASAGTGQSPDLFPIDRAVTQALGNLRLSIEESGASIVMIEPLPEVCGVETQIAQVIQNLLSNSMKYRRQNVPLVIKVSATRQGSQWRIDIKDNGQGFAPDQAARIFDFLKRLHGRDVPGSGIGLTICKTIIERNGGTIGAVGTPGEGSTFWFSLPASCSQ